MYELALFAGIGGGLLGSILRGHVIVGAVEIEDYARRVLLQRQSDGLFDPFPIWSDITTFRRDNEECREYIEKLAKLDNLCISGGFPCQGISLAGKRRGLDDPRSGLWFEMERVIREIRPRFVFLENTPNLVRDGLPAVLAGLAAIGYDARWGIIGAADAGAPHKRDRIWIVAYGDLARLEKRKSKPGDNVQKLKTPERGRDVDHASSRRREKHGAQ